jgi:hypothetical protein
MSEKTQTIESRVSECRSEIGRLETALSEAIASWQKAVSEGDSKSEAAALKTRQTAEASLGVARERVGVLEQSLRAAHVESLGTFKESTEARLKEANGKAARLAHALQALHAQQMVAAREILQLEREHGTALAEFARRYREVRGRGVEDAGRYDGCASREFVVSRNALIEVLPGLTDNGYRERTWQRLVKSYVPVEPEPEPVESEPEPVASSASRQTATIQ